MASTRELFLILRGRDEASRVVNAFSRNVRSAAMAAKAAQLEARSAALRQQAAMLENNSVLKKNIDQINGHTIALDKQARQYSLAAAQARQYRDSLISVGANDQQIDAVHRQVQKLQHQAAIFARQASINRNAAAQLRHELGLQVTELNRQAHALDVESKQLRIAAADSRSMDVALGKVRNTMMATTTVALGLAAGFGAATAAGVVAIAAFVKTAAEYERQTHATRTQVDGLKYSVEQLGDVGRRVAKEIGVRFEEIQPALFDIFSSMEVGIGDAEKLLKAFSKGAVAGQTDIQAVSRATIGLMNAFKLPISDVNRILDLQFELVQEGIGTYEEWNQRIGLVTPSAVRAGQSIEMMVAALAASTRFGISAARSGTAVARAFDAMSHPKSIKHMELLGIKVRDATGEMRPMNLVLREFREVLDKMPKKDRLAAILDVFKGAGGTIEARRFLQNILLGKNGLETFDMILKETANSSGNMEKAYATMADTTSNKTQLLRNQWKLLAEGIGKALLPSVNNLIDRLNQLIGKFNALPESTKKTIANFLVWGVAIGAATTALLGIIGALAAFIALVAVAGTPLGVVILVILGVVAALALLGGAFTAAWKNSANFRDFISNMIENGRQLGAIFRNTASSIKESWDKNISPALSSFARVLDEDVMPVVEDFRSSVMEKLVPAVEDLSEKLRDLVEIVFQEVKRFIEDDLIPAIKRLTDIYNENKTTIDLIIGAMVNFMKVAAILIMVLGAGGLVGSLRVLGFSIQIFAFSLQVAIGITMFFINVIRSVISWIIRLVTSIRVGGVSIGEAFKTIANHFNAFKFMVASVVSNVASRFGTLRSLLSNPVVAAINIVIAQFNMMRAIANSVRNAIVNTFQSMRSGIVGVFSGAGSWLFGAGVSIVRGLIGGISSQIGALRAVLANLTAMIPKVKGPKEKDLRLLRPAGRHIIQGLRSGINDMVPNLKNTLADVTDLVKAQGSAQRLAPTGPLGPVGFSNGQERTSKVINQNIVVNTNEIDPRLHAQQMGFEILSRM